MHVYTHMNIFMCTCAYMHVRKFSCTYLFPYMYVYTYLFTKLFMCVCKCVCLYVYMYVCTCVRMYVCIYTSHPVRTTHQSSCISDGVSQHNNSVPSDNICTSRLLNCSGRGWVSALLLVVVSPATFQHPAPSPHLYPWPGTWSVEPHKFATNFNLCETIHMEISHRTASFNIFFVFHAGLPCFTELCDKLTVIPFVYLYIYIYIYIYIHRPSTTFHLGSEIRVQCNCSFEPVCYTSFFKFLIANATTVFVPVCLCVYIILYYIILYSINIYIKHKAFFVLFIGRWSFWYCALC